MKESQINPSEHSDVKVKLLKIYLEKYLSILNLAAGVEQINVFDLFSGEGLYTNGSKGSPIIEPLIGPVGELDLSGIHWVIVGGESGPGARPMKPEWAEDVKRQCEEQNVAFFFKQWGSWGSDGVKRNKKANGRIFQGKERNEEP